MSNYVELHCHSNFSLLDGASHPEDLVKQAASLGMPALALTDHDGLYAAVRFYKACKEAGIKPIIGAELTLENDRHVTLLARNNVGYSNLCRLITKAQLDHQKGSAAIDFDSLSQHSGGIFCLSGCRRGEIASLLLSGELKQAYEAVTRCLP